MSNGLNQSRNLGLELSSDLSADSDSEDENLDQESELSSDKDSEEAEDVTKVEPKEEIDDDCVMKSCDERDFNNALENRSTKLKTEQVDKGYSNGETQIKEELFSSISPEGCAQDIEDDTNNMQKNDSESPNKQCENVTKIEEGNIVAANCDEKVEQNDFDDSTEHLSSRLVNFPESATEVKEKNVNNRVEAKIMEEGIPESVSPVSAVQGVQVHAEHERVKDKICTLCPFKSYYMHSLRKHVKRVHEEGRIGWRKGRPTKKYNSSAGVQFNRHFGRP